jgi:glycine betaine catabolism A
VNGVNMPVSDPPWLAPLVASRLPGHGLPRDFYLNADLYSLEIQLVWKTGWLFAGHACEIPSPGDYFTLALDSDPLLVIRGEDGLVRAFHNVCRHRGMILCQEQSGRDLVACKGMHDVDRAQLGLFPVACETVAGLIFVSLAEHPPPFAEARELFGKLVAPQGIERAKAARIIDYEIAADWKLVWENNRECYHCDANHPEYVRSNFDVVEADRATPAELARVAEREEDARRRWRDAGLEPSQSGAGIVRFPDPQSPAWFSATRSILADGYESETTDGRRVAPLMGDYRSPDVGLLRLRSLPNFCAHASCDHVATLRLLPGGPRRTLARMYWLVDAEAREGQDYDSDALTALWRLTSERDWQLCELTQKGVQSSAYQPGPLSKLREYNVEAFIAWYLRLLQGPKQGVLPATVQ